MLQKAQTAKETSTEAEIEEEIRLAWNKVYADNYLNNYTIYQKASELKNALNENGNGNIAILDNDENTVRYRGKEICIDEETGGIDIRQPLPTIGNGEKAVNSNAIFKSGNYTAVIPSGFTVSNHPGESSIETGLVIRDDAGNEFVWIPVGIKKISNPEEKILLGRYDFAQDGTPSTYSGSYVEEDSSNRTYPNYSNIVAKNINKFIENTNKAGGFWIGRYEARTTSSTARTAQTNELTEATENPENAIYDYVTQIDAATVSQRMYADNKYFECDLTNSYAWDTATLFLQEYDDRENRSIPYSQYCAGYNEDKICNIFDMSRNRFEWVTETINNSGSPYVRRGGSNQWGCTSKRTSFDSADPLLSYSFRPILYLK